MFLKLIKKSLRKKKNRNAPDCSSAVTQCGRGLEVHCHLAKINNSGLRAVAASRQHQATRHTNQACLAERKAVALLAARMMHLLSSSLTFQLI